jgi:hypothetical protein
MACITTNTAAALIAAYHPEHSSHGAKSISLLILLNEEKHCNQFGYNAYRRC